MTNSAPMAIIALLASTATAIAGGLGAPPAPPAAAAPAVPAPATPFEGFYAGLAYGVLQGDGTNTVTPPGVTGPFDIGSDGALGGFAGYNFRNGNLVLGAELGVWAVDGQINDGGVRFDRLVDARGRAGLAAGDAMFYGALGWSWGRHGNPAGTNVVDMDGYSFGLGVEYNVTETMFLGLDYTSRNLEGSAPPGLDYEIRTDTLSLRGGFRF